jgi:hypothetical protein
LNPRFESAGTLIIEELDEFGEVSFITRGKVAIGYEINKMKKYQILYRNKCVIGAFGATFNQRATFFY